MNIFIVYAHPEPQSFNAAMKDTAAEVLTKAGQKVRVSDLVAMEFKAVSDANDFPRRADPERLVFSVEQRAAFESGLTSPDIAEEHEKIIWADHIIFQFPMWYYGLPAILKGWFDRVLSEGFAHAPPRWFDDGPMAGKRAMLSLTTNGKPSGYAADGRHGAMEVLVWPIHNALRFCGFDVLPPFVAYDVVRGDGERRRAILSAYADRLRGLAGDKPLAFHGLDDYDRDGRLKAGVEPRTAAQRMRLDKDGR